jgi:hypothetical protein
MRRLTGSLLLAATILSSAGLVTACGQNGSGAIASLSPGKAASVVPSKAESTAAGAAASASAAGASTAAAASTAPQTTAAPTPAPQTSTAQTSTAATSAAPASSAQASSSTAAPASGSGSSLLWLWIVIGLAVLAGLIAWIVHSARRRTAAGAVWRTKVIDVYAEAMALHDAIWAAVSQGPPADGAADLRQSSIWQRADDLTQDLYGLRELAPDEERHARVADVLGTLQAVRTAMEASTDVGGRLAAFQTALRALRASADPEF